MSQIPGVLRLAQFLGYFPIRLQPNGIPTNHKLTTKQIAFRSLFSSTFWCVIPSIFYSLLGISVIFIFIFDFTNIKSTISPKSLATRGTFYSALIIKSASHLFCSIFIKVDMLYRRRAFQRFYTNFKKLLEFGQTLLGDGKVLKCNRFEKRLHKETFALLLLVTLLSLEMAVHFTYRKEYTTYIFVYLVPAVLGYLHSIFTVLLVYFLNWYLGILKGISFLVRNKVEVCKTLPKMKHFGQCSGKANRFRANCGCNWVKKDSQGLSDLYNRVRDQAEQFNKLFGLWLAIDKGHSLLRIVISSYFNASLLSKQVYQWRSILGNVMTVLLYFYLLYAVCKKGSDIVEESRGIVDGMDTMARVEGGNLVIKNTSKEKKFKFCYKTIVSRTRVCFFRKQ